MSSNNINNYMYDGKSIEEWDSLANDYNTGISDKEALDMGIIREEDNNQADETTPETLQGNVQKTTIAQPSEERTYEKTSIPSTLKDIGQTVGDEALRFIAPKDNSLVSNMLGGYSEDDLYKHQARTKAAENMRYIYRYGMGTLATIASLAVGGEALAGAKVASMIPKAASLMNLANKSRLATAIFGGAFGGAIADFNLYRPEEGEGHLADAFGVTDNPLITLMQSDNSAPEWQERLKNVAEGFIVGAGVGIAGEYVLMPLLKTTLKNTSVLKNFLNNKATEEEALDAMESIATNDIKIKKFSDTNEILQTVNESIEKADKEALDPEDVLLSIPMETDDLVKAKRMLQIRQAGDDVFIHEDGSFDTAVDSWEKAAKVSQEEYTKQLRAKDLYNNEENFGNSAISDMNAAYRDTWQNRGLLGTNETINQSKATKIVNSYKTKWDIPKDTKIKVEVVDGLVNQSGSPIEGITQSVNPKEITIRLDKNSKNINATLRSELEHARDIAKGTVPDQNVQHFSRYTGLNEGEASVNLTYKKAVSKANKINKVQPKPTEASLSPVKKEVNSNLPKQEEKSLVEPPALSETQNKLNNAKTSADILETATSSGLKDVNDIEKAINKTIEVDPELKSFKWNDIETDSNKLLQEVDGLIEGDNKELLSALFAGKDAATISETVRKMLGAAKLSNNLYAKFKDLNFKPDTKTQANLIDSMYLLSSYIKNGGSSLGGGLNAMKLVNKNQAIVGDLRLSQTVKDGLAAFTDSLYKDIKDIFNLEFTKGQKIDKLKLKQQIYEKVFDYADGELRLLLSNDTGFSKRFEEILDKAIKVNGNMTKEELGQSLVDMVTSGFYNRLTNTLKYTTDKPAFFKTVVNNMADYYVTNLLSSPKTQAKNIISGVTNTALFPFYKVLSIGGKEAPLLRAEGLATYKSFMSNLGDAFRAACQTFKSGEGSFVNLGKDTLNVDDTYKSIFDLTSKNPIVNTLTFMSRFMGASDEFLTQLNYRSIVKGKAYTRVMEQAKLAGKLNDNNWIENQVNSYFDRAFSSKGMPTDLDAFYEAKEIMFQAPLNGKMFNPLTEEMEQIANPTAVRQVGEKVQSLHRESGGLTRFLAPFVRTNLNIMQFSLDHNLIYSLVSPQARKTLLSNTRAGYIARSKVLIGTMGTLYAIHTAFNGRITGSMPRDASEREALLNSGWRPYSIRIGDEYISYQGYEPFQTLLGTAADLAQLYSTVTNEQDQLNVEKIAMESMTLINNNFLDKAGFRGGIQAIGLLLDPDYNNSQKIKQAIANIGQGFLPAVSMVRTVSSLGERDQTQPKTIQDRMFNLYGNRGLGEYRRDAFGNKLDINSNFLSQSTTAKYEPEYEELVRLGELGYNPTDITDVISETTLKYSDFKDDVSGRSARDLMLEELSKTELQQKVRELITSSYYKQLPDGRVSDAMKEIGVKYGSGEETKVNALNDLFIEYNDIAEQNVLDNYSDRLKDKNGRTMGQAFEQAEVTKANIRLNSEIGNTANTIRSLF